TSRISAIVGGTHAFSHAHAHARACTHPLDDDDDVGPGVVWGLGERVAWPHPARTRSTKPSRHPHPHEPVHRGGACLRGSGPSRRPRQTRSRWAGPVFGNVHMRDAPRPHGVTVNGVSTSEI